LNIVFKYGYDAFLKRCAELKVSGLVTPDLPYESRAEIVPFAEKYGIDIIPLITPTAGHRIEKIAKSAPGFIYVV
ncbi:tryptophan synthase subunit alpha, partial [Salmonella enterica subsp. enterica serovar Istanbul]|nr:tryptophan synthase subunit alpha [Salmonella enterica subsp. enterica serovar Istanbul]